MLTKISNNKSCDLSTIHSSAPKIPNVPFLHLRSFELVDSILSTIFSFTLPFKKNKREKQPTKKNGSMLVLFLLVFFTPASVRIECLSNLEASNNPNEIQEKGVLFHERSKILLAEKFIKIEFLVPFPTYVFALRPDIVALMAKLASMWELPSICFLSLGFFKSLFNKFNAVQCHLDVTTNRN